MRDTTGLNAGQLMWVEFTAEVNLPKSVLKAVIECFLRCKKCRDRIGRVVSPFLLASSMSTSLPFSRSFFRSPAVHLLLAFSFLLQAGCTTEAEPSNPQNMARFVQGVGAQQKFKSGDYAGAIEMLETLPPVESKDGSGNVDSDFALGEVYFANGQAAESAAAFDRVVESKPELKPQLWQRGLALYYADRYADVVDQLESHQNYNKQDVENSVWHVLAASKLSSVEEARKAMIEITQDTRPAMPEVYEMFAGRGSVEQVRAAAEASKNQSAIYHSTLYIGLFHEMMGEAEKSQAAIEMAIKLNPFPPNAFMGNVASMHAKARGYGVEDKPKK